MDGRRLFQIPVYRLPFDRWAAEGEDLAEGHMKAMSEYRPELESRILAYQSIKWQPWEFNEVIAWVVVVGLPDMVKVYLSRRKGQRFHRRPTGPFQRDERSLTELNVYPEHTNASLSSEVRDAITTALKTEPGLSKRFVDFESYDLVAPNLDWRQMIGAPAGQLLI
jgi:hypothetical protein